MVAEAVVLARDELARRTRRTSETLGETSVCIERDNHVDAKRIAGPRDRGGAGQISRCAAHDDGEAGVVRHAFAAAVGIGQDAGDDFRGDPIARDDRAYALGAVDGRRVDGATQRANAHDRDGERDTRR